MGAIRVQMPPGLRKSGIPDSVLIPASVNTTARRASAIRRAGAAIPLSRFVAVVMAVLWQNEPTPPSPVRLPHAMTARGLSLRGAERRSNLGGPKRTAKNGSGSARAEGADHRRIEG